MLRYTMFIGSLLGLASVPATGATFTESFDGPSISPALSVPPAPGYSFGLSGGRGVISKAEATTSGFATISTRFFAIGDFSAQVTADRADNRSASSGLATGHTNGFTDVYFFGSSNVVANMFVGPGFGQTILSDASQIVDFRIRRVGNTIFEEYDPERDGSFVIVRQATGDALLGEVQFSLFMGQEQGNQGAASMAYDNLIITADAFRDAVPEPASWAMMVAGFGLAGAASRRRKAFVIA